MNVDIVNCGAVADGVTLNTTAIQTAIDRCAEAGGGIVNVPPGEFVTGTVELKSHVYLNLEPGATLLASEDPTDYRKIHSEEFCITAGCYDAPLNLDEHLVYAENASHVGVLGAGAIDARGEAFFDSSKKRAICDKNKSVEYTARSWRPGATIAFFNCTQVKVEDISVCNFPMPAVWLNSSSDVRIVGVRLQANTAFYDCDGIHIWSSSNVFISQCHIDAEDDAIGIFSGWSIKEWGDCDSILVSDCVLSSACTAVRIAWSGSGSISNLTFSNIIVTGAKKGIDFLSFDNRDNIDGLNHTGVPYKGTKVSNVLFDNLLVRNALTGVTANIRVHGDGASCGIENITFSNARFLTRRGNYLLGDENVPIRNITFRDAEFCIKGQASVDEADLPNPYPICGCAEFPYGFAMRHVDDVRFYNCRLSFGPEASGWEEALHMEECSRIDDEGLRIEETQ